MLFKEMVCISVCLSVYVRAYARKCILFLIFRLCHIIIKNVWIDFCKYFIDANQFDFEYTTACTKAPIHSHTHIILLLFLLYI